MTDLDKPVTRRSRAVSRGRRIVVTLRPDDMIEFRLAGTQETCKASIASLMRNAQRMDSGIYIAPRKK